MLNVPRAGLIDVAEAFPQWSPPAARRLEEDVMDRTSPRRIRWAACLLAAMIGATLTAGTAAAAAGPEHFGPFEVEYSFVGFNCDGFDVLIEGASTDAFTVWSDATGEVEKILYRARPQHDTLTNLTTGKSIIVRGEFQETIVRDPSTGDFIKTITGFRYLVNEPGTGVTVRDVGRITYGDLAQTIVLWEAGYHDLALDAQIEPAFCAALA
jgi:hypothetical protein